MKGNSQREEVAQHSQRLQLVGIVSEMLCRGMDRSFYMCTVAPNKYVRYARKEEPTPGDHDRGQELLGQGEKPCVRACLCGSGAGWAFSRGFASLDQVITLDSKGN